MIYRQLGFSEASKRPGQTPLTLASVAIGVAAVVAVSFSGRSTRTAFDQIFQALAGRASLEVTAPVGQTIPESVAADIAEVPGVKALAPRLQRPAILYVNQERAQLVAAAVDPQRDQQVHDYTVVDGEPLGDEGGVLLEQLLAENLGVNVGDRAFLLTRRGRIRLRITGLFASGTAGLAGQGARLIVPLRQGQHWFLAPQSLDTIQIVLAEGADEAQVRAAIEPHVPSNADLRRPGARSTTAEETVLSTNQALEMARSFILLVATFVIANTFLMNVTQRRRQFGTLRALGATRGQVAAVVLIEALVLGIVGAVIGSLLGVGIAHALTQGMGAIYETELPSIQLTQGPFVWGGAFGIAISLIGAVIPAIKAARLPPFEALRDVLPEEVEGASRPLLAIGVVTVVCCSVLLAMSIAGRLRTDVSIYAGVFGLVGLVLILPVGMPAIGGVAAAVWPRRTRTEAHIAARQMLIHRTRTTLTVGVVFIAASAAVGLASTVLDNIQNIRNWYNTTMVADFFVRATMPNMATGTAADLPDGLEDEIREIEGITGLDGVRFVGVKAADQDVILVVRNLQDELLYQFDLVEGDEQSLRSDLTDGQVAIGSVLAQRGQLKLGDEISLETDEGARSFRIAAILNDYQAGGLTVYMNRDVAQQFMQIGGVDAFVIKADSDQIDSVREGLLALTRSHGLLLQSLSQLKGEINLMISSVEAGLWGLVALGLLIATFGVINTLMISVLEQTYEFGLLRAIAATRGQIRGVILAQAVMLGAVALVPAVVTGIGISYLINLSTYSATGHVIPFQVRPLLSLAALAGGMTAILIAALIPAERASRVPLGTILRVR
ncbi:MAG TPA: FtsX-like permease family protein [Lacipirellulaceae bacterium]|nr:FtsX-like permease family protein [Lacipirellulaceae bacterium]